MVKEETLSKPQYQTTHEKNIETPMRDGTILRANITRPNEGGEYPVLLECTPYDKEGGSENAVGAPEFYAQRGYAVVIQDIRGRFASDGEFYPFRDDGADLLRDGYDTIEWIAKQPWANGKVYKYEIDLWATSNLNPGGPIHQEAIGQIAINAVFHDEMWPSHIVLPVIPR